MDTSVPFRRSIHELNEKGGKKGKRKKIIGCHSLLQTKNKKNRKITNIEVSIKSLALCLCLSLSLSLPLSSRRLREGARAHYFSPRLNSSVAPREP
jgi:hypothetical protein